MHRIGKVLDMKALYNDGSVAEVEADEAQHVIRHSAAHIMAQAIKHLYPEADFAYGPATDNGFYYDVDLGDKKISEDDLPTIEAEMKKIVKENLKFQVFELPREEAIALMEERGEKYKVEHIGDLADDARITFYQQGDYIDMCVGPHLTYTKALKAFKLTGVSGAYWKNDANNKMLTRINGTAFATKDELEAHLTLLEEAKKRDHRRIGREMDLFMMRDEAPGFPFFLPNGMVLKNTLLDYWREIHHKAGYVEISTPQIMNKSLWLTSGHWDHYKDNMYSTMIDDEEYCIKPMNCPGGVLVYSSKPHSYRELPIRAGEIGLVHRHELRGALHGLFRVRCFNQDDAHLFVTPAARLDLAGDVVGNRRRRARRHELLVLLLGQRRLLARNGALCDHDDGEARTRLHTAVDRGDHAIHLVGDLGDQAHIRTAGDGGIQGNPTDLVPHDLDHKDAAVAARGGVDVVDALGRDLDRTREAEGDVGPPCVIVDGLRQRDHVQALLRQAVGGLGGAVSAQHEQAVEAEFAIGPLHSGDLVHAVGLGNIEALEGCAARAQDRAAAHEDAAEVGRGHLAESFVDEALIAIFETEDLDRFSRAMVESLDDAAHRRVERLAIAAAGQKADSNHRYPSRSWCAPADGTASEVFSHVHQCTPNGASRGSSAPIAYIHASL